MRPRASAIAGPFQGKLAHFDAADWPVIGDDGMEWPRGHPARQARSEGATQLGALCRWQAARLAVLTPNTSAYRTEVLEQIRERVIRRQRWWSAGQWPPADWEAMRDHG